MDIAHSYQNLKNGRGFTFSVAFTLASRYYNHKYKLRELNQFGGVTITKYSSFNRGKPLNTNMLKCKINTDDLNVKNEIDHSSEFDHTL